MPFCYFPNLESVSLLSEHIGKSNRNFGKGLAVPGDQLGFLAILETKGPQVCQVFQMILDAGPFGGPPWGILSNWHEACWTDKSSQSNRS